MIEKIPLHLQKFTVISLTGWAKPKKIRRYFKRIFKTVKIYETEFPEIYLVCAGNLRLGAEDFQTSEFTAILNSVGICAEVCLRPWGKPVNKLLESWGITEHGLQEIFQESKQRN